LASLTALSAARGDYVRAEAFAREALDVQRRTLGVEHPLTTEDMALVARQLAGQRRYGEAEALLRDALALIERTMGPQHPRVAEQLTPLAGVHSAMGRLGDAESELRRGLAVVERSGRRERTVAEVSALLGDVLARRGDSVESAAMFDRASSILRALPPQVGPDVRAAYAALADHAKAMKRPADEDYFRRAARGGSQWGAITPVP
jgi:tetratricopeptide (TPR) repeat protein